MNDGKVIYSQGGTVRRFKRLGSALLVVAIPLILVSFVGSCQVATNLLMLNVRQGDFGVTWLRRAPGGPGAGGFAFAFHF